jgi:predicted secreted hydrolase
MEGLERIIRTPVRENAESRTQNAERGAQTVWSVTPLVRAPGGERREEGRGRREEGRRRHREAFALLSPPSSLFPPLSSLLTLSVLLSALWALPVGGFAQTDPDGYRHAVPGYRYQFPRDHGAHFEYRLEWWYFTGHLTTESGAPFGFEVTFFRVGVPPLATEAASAWDLRHLAMTHFAVSDVASREFRYYEKLNRFVPYLAGASPERMNVFNENWRLEQKPDGSFSLRAAASGDAVDLILRPRKPPVIHGKEGVSVKAAGLGYASHYYSMTRLETQGTVTSRGKRERCRGIAWMDHEFSSSALREHQAGWDWFAIQLDNGAELMFYQMRTRDGVPDENSSGTFVGPDGSAQHLEARDFEVRPRGRWKSPKSGATYPMGWTIRVPRLGLELQLRERLKDQELVTSATTQVTYWEGAVTIEGTMHAAPVRGLGYVEMSGYARPLSLR